MRDPVAHFQPHEPRMVALRPSNTRSFELCHREGAIRDVIKLKHDHVSSRYNDLIYRHHPTPRVDVIEADRPPTTELDLGVAH